MSDVIDASSVSDVSSVADVSDIGCSILRFFSATDTIDAMLSSADNTEDELTHHRTDSAERREKSAGFSSFSIEASDDGSSRHTMRFGRILRNSSYASRSDSEKRKSCSSGITSPTCSFEDEHRIS